MTTISRLFISGENISGQNFSITDQEDINKIKRVLRLEIGSKVELNNNQGKLYIGEIKAINRSGISGKIISESDLKDKYEDHSSISIALAQALPKGHKMDDIIKMNTEVGVDEFIPFESDFSVIQIKNFHSKKIGRWEKIVKEAARQSERAYIPSIQPPMKFEEMLEYKSKDFARKLILHSRMIGANDNYTPIDITVIKKSLKPSYKVLLAVGPEGGFSDSEIELALKNGFEAVSMNLPILRTETAGIVACGILLS